MNVLRERDLELSLPHGVEGRKFDDQGHGLSHCMKAVDFIVEEPGRTLFMEFKDQDNPHAKPDKAKAFMDSVKSGEIIKDLYYKYRDSFIYRWAEGAVDKPAFYYVLIAAEKLDAAMLLHLTEDLKRQLPVKGPKSGQWKRRIVAGCGVFNIETWNRQLTKYRVSRTGAHDR